MIVMVLHAIFPFVVDIARNVASKTSGVKSVPTPMYMNTYRDNSFRVQMQTQV